MNTYDATYLHSDSGMNHQVTPYFLQGIANNCAFSIAGQGNHLTQVTPIMANFGHLKIIQPLKVQPRYYKVFRRKQWRIPGKKTKTLSSEKSNLHQSQTSAVRTARF